MQHRQNSVVIINNTALIALRRMDGSLKATVAIDEEDWERVRHISWSLSGNGYAHGYFKEDKYIYLHHLIAGQPPNLLKTDHRSRNKSGYTGVFRRGDTYRTWIDKDGVRTNLGSYSSAEEAASVREKALEERR